MHTTVMWLLGAYGLALLLLAVGSRVREFQSWQVSRLATTVGLGVPRDLDAKLRARVSGRMLGFAVGGLAGLGIGWALSATVTRQWFVLTFYVPLGISILGSALGQALVSYRQVFAKDSRPRIARLTDVALSSYVPSAFRLVAWIQVIFAAATVLVAVLGERSAAAFATTPFLALAILGLLALEVLGRRLADRGQVATTTDELVWDDALRSSSLIEVAFGAQYVILVGAILPIALELSAGRYWILVPAGLLALGAVVFRAMLGESRTWYLTELWPGSRRRTPEEEEARLASHV